MNESTGFAIGDIRFYRRLTTRDFMILLLTSSFLISGCTKAATTTANPKRGVDTTQQIPQEQSVRPPNSEPETSKEPKGIGKNLIVNGDAEAAPASSDGSPVRVPGWYTDNNFTTIRYGGRSDVLQPESRGPNDRGNNFFNGGNSESARASQNINVTDRAANIDSGSVTYTLSGWLGGYASQNDNAVLAAYFLDERGRRLATASIGPVTNVDRQNETMLIFRSTSGKVPIGTRRIEVILTFTRAEGTLDDGYADNLSFTLSP